MENNSCNFPAINNLINIINCISISTVNENYNWERGVAISNPVIPTKLDSLENQLCVGFLSLLSLNQIKLVLKYWLLIPKQLLIILD